MSEPLLCDRTLNCFIHGDGDCDEDTTTGLIKEVKPVSLEQRVLEAAEQQRRSQLHRDSVNLERALVRVGIITSKLAADEIKVTKQGQVRYDLDGVLFFLHTWANYEYDDHGEVVGDTEISHLNAQLICRYEGCHRGVSYPQVNNVQKLADLAPLFNPEDRRCTESYCDLYGRNGRPDRHNGKNDDGSDIYGFDPDELSSLPF